MSQKSILTFFKPLGEQNHLKRVLSEENMASKKKVSYKLEFV